MRTESRKSRSELLQSQIMEMHRAGLTVKAMAEQLGITTDAVNYHRYKLGIKTYSKRITPEIRAVVFKMKQSGLGTEEISDRLKLHKSSVVRVLAFTDTSRFSFADMMANPVNKLLACRWSPKSVRNCLV